MILGRDSLGLSALGVGAAASNSVEPIAESQTNAYGMVLGFAVLGVALLGAGNVTASEPEPALARVSVRHVSTSNQLLLARARHDVQFSLLNQFKTHHAINSQSMLGAAARHNVRFSLLNSLKTHHRVQFSAMTSAVNRHAISYRSMLGAGNHHRVQFSAMTDASNRHAINYQSMLGIGNHHRVQFSAMNGVSVKNIVAFGIRCGFSMHHQANAELSSANYFSGRHTANAGMPNTDVLIQNSEIKLEHQGRLIGCYSYTLACDEGSPLWTGSCRLDSVNDYAVIAIGDEIALTTGGVIFNLICASKQYDRDDPPSYLIKAFSPIAALGKDWSAPVKVVATGMAQAVVNELLGQTTDWQIVDWMLPSEVAELEASPLEIAQQIVATVGGLIESLPDGGLVVRSTHPVSVPDYALAVNVIQMTDRDLFAHSAAIDAPVVANRFVVTSGEVDTPKIKLEAIQDDADSHRYTIRAYPSPWRPVALVHTGDAETQVSARTEITEQHEELVSILKGTGALSYPPSAVVSWQYQYADLGTVTFGTTENVQTAAAEYSQLAVQYSVRAWEWQATNSRAEDIQFLAVE